jgi:hypothetical protein
VDVPEPRLTRGSFRLALGAVLAAAGLVRVWGIGFGLPNLLCHPDELAAVAVARGFLGGDLHPRFFDWPTFYLYVLAAAYGIYWALGRVTGASGALGDFAANPLPDWRPLFLIDRGLAAALGTATVAVVWKIGERVFDRATGLVSAAFMALAFLHVRDSHFGVTDVPATFLTTWSVLFVLRAHDDGRLRDHGVAGLLAGVAAATKYNAALVCMPMLASAAIRMADATSGRERVRVLPGLGLFAMAAVVGLVGAMPWVVLDAGGVLAALARVQAHLRDGHGIDLGRGWSYHLSVTLRYGLGWPLLVAGLGGLAYAWARDWRRAAILSAFPVAYYVVMGQGRAVFVRHALPVVPFLCITGAALVVVAGRWVAAGTRRPSMFAGVTAVLAVLVIVPSVVSVVRFDRLVARTDSRVLAARWLRDSLPPGSSVYQSGGLYGLVVGGTPGVERWSYDERRDVFLAGGRSTGELPEWIVLQESPLVLYSEVPAGVRAHVASPEYELVQAFVATDPAATGNVFSEQDAFFLPITGFQGVRRPGPNFYVYRRRRTAHAISVRALAAVRASPTRVVSGRYASTTSCLPAGTSTARNPALTVSTGLDCPSTRAVQPG